MGPCRDREGIKKGVPQKEKIKKEESYSVKLTLKKGMKAQS